MDWQLHTRNMKKGSRRGPDYGIAKHEIRTPPRARHNGNNVNANVSRASLHNGTLAVAMAARFLAGEIVWHTLRPNHSSKQDGVDDLCILYGPQSHHRQANNAL